MSRILRKLPLLAALLAFGAVFVWLDSDKDFKREVYPERSLHNIAAKGASLAFRYLKESRGPKAPAVNELHRMIDYVELEPNAVVFRIGPTKKPGEHENPDSNKTGLKNPPPVKPVVTGGPLLTDGELKWVKNGGRLVLALDKNYGPVEVVNQAKGDDFKKTFDVWPGVNRFHPRPARTLNFKGASVDKAKSIAVLDNTYTLFALNGEIFAARILLDGGTGDVIVLASPEIFTNSHVGEADNLKLLEQLAPSTRPIYFDEFVHGLHTSPGILEMLVRWGMGMALLVMLSGSMVLFWRARASIGPPEDDHKETRTEAIDFVNSLAPLYNRVLEPHQAIALHYKNFIHTVTAQSGLRGADLREKIFALLGTSDEAGLSGRRALTPSEFFSLLKTLNEAYGRLERAHRR